MNGRTPLDPDAMRSIRKTLNIGAWNGSGALYGTRAQVREARRLLRQALRGKVARLQFVNDRLLTVMARFAKPFKLVSGWDVSRTIGVILPVYGLLKGTPTSATLPSAYWRTTLPESRRTTLEGDQIGLLWCVPVLPNTGADATAVTDLSSRMILEHGFEPQMSLSLISERSMICITTISYDRRRPGEDERALACYRKLTEALIAGGYPPYRLNVAAMDYLDEGGEYGRVIRALKTALDPQGILAPGRYDAGLSR
jgi:4-cresol dehydrogenase (hydroxylating)